MGSAIIVNVSRICVVLHVSDYGTILVVFGCFLYIFALICVTCICTCSLVEFNTVGSLVIALQSLWSCMAPHNKCSCVIYTYNLLVTRLHLSALVEVNNFFVSLV